MIPKKRKPTTPGEMLEEEYLKPLNISQRKFADHLDWLPKKLNEIIKGKVRVTSETALCFSEALNTTPQFWLNLQNAVDLWEASRRHKKKSLLERPTGDIVKVTVTFTP